MAMVLYLLFVGSNIKKAMSFYHVKHQIAAFIGNKEAVSKETRSRQE